MKATGRSKVVMTMPRVTPSIAEVITGIWLLTAMTPLVSPSPGIQKRAPTGATSNSSQSPQLRE